MHMCTYNTLLYIIGWSNTPKGVNAYGVYRYTLKGGTVIKHKSILYFSNFVTKPFNNNHVDNHKWEKFCGAKHWQMG